MSDYLLSMTGYGEATIVSQAKELRIVVQSVNSRYLDCRCRLPHAFQSLDPKIRTAAKKYIERGKVDIVLTSISDEVASSDQDISSSYFNSSYIAGFCRAGVGVVESLGWPADGQIHSSLLQSAFSRREAFDAPSDNVEDLTEAIADLLEQALTSHCQSRENEGRSLAADFRHRISLLSDLLAQVELLAETMPAIFQQRIEERITLILADNNFELDQARLCQEVAYLIDKSDISEEIVRLKAHLDQFINELESQTTRRKGKKLEFIVQEMLREINTIGSKANLLEITRNVVDMKNELEKIREQVQNVI